MLLCFYFLIITCCDYYIVLNISKRKNLIKYAGEFFGVNLLLVCFSDVKENDSFWILQISCSSVGQMLNFILSQESLIISSAYGKKKKKLLERSRSNLPHNVICKGGDALSLLSSLLDVLLLKKDIANRSAFWNVSNSEFSKILCGVGAKYFLRLN